MNTRRDEFRWQPTSRSKSKLATSLLLSLAALATGYAVVNSGYRPRAEDTETSFAGEVKPPIDEPSSVAFAPLPVEPSKPHRTSLSLAGPVGDEPSASPTTAPLPTMRRSTARAPATTERGSSKAPRSTTSESYATLRQALLRKMR